MRSKIFAKLKTYAKPVKPVEPKKSTIKRKNDINLVTLSLSDQFLFNYKDLKW